VAVVVGLQDHFDWRGVAASAVGAGVGPLVDGAIGDSFGKTDFGQFAKAAVTGLAAGTAAAIARGGRIAVQQIATDAFGNALGSSFVDSIHEGQQEKALQAREDARDAEMSRLLRGENSGVSSVGTWNGGEAWASDLAMREAVNNPYGLPTSSPLITQAAPVDDTRVIRDFDPNGTWDPDALGGYGDIKDGSQLAAGGTVRVVRGNAIPRTGGEANVLDPIPSTVNGVSVNQKTASLIQAAGDLAGAGDLYRDIKLLGALMSDGVQQSTIDKLKANLQDRLGMMRIVPSESDLGAVQSIGSDGVPRWDKADLMDRYSDAARKVELMKAGVIELDTRSMMVKSIGTEKLTPDQWVVENTRRYQGAFAVGMEEGQRRYDAGTLRYPADMPSQLQIGSFADNAARTAVIAYNQSIGVPEGPGQLLSMNRWSYDPSGSGLYNRVDMLMDLGPNRNNGALILRTALEGKSSLEAVQSSVGQLQKVYNWVTPKVITATPQGTAPWTPVAPKRLR
jgi:hypothetical protein